MKKIDILGVILEDCSLMELLERVSVFVRTERKRKIMYANIHVINMAQHDDDLKMSINSSDIVYCDGEGIRLASKILGETIPERMTGADWIYDLCDMAEKNGYSIYLLGARNGVAEKTKKILTGRYKDIKIVGFHHGYFDFTGEENEQVILDINSKKPDILLVGFGTPLQEKWINRNVDKLDAAVVWAVGAVMDFVSDQVKRAPEFMLKHSMEWLYRLYQEPKRLWERYLIGNITFFFKILMEWNVRGKT